MIHKLSGMIPPVALPDEPSVARKGNKEGSDFLETLNGFMNEVNQLQQESGESVKRLVSGDITNIHDVMIAVEKASVSFDLMMEIRNKVIEAYRELMRTQV